jgi:hypothetical protein
MAIYHLSIKIISRGKGKSAVAAAAYRAGEKITNEYDGIEHDYTKKSGVVHTEILLPDNAPETYKNRAVLWNEVERIEKAKNSQLAREIELTLPVELSIEQNIFIVREYVNRNFVEHGMCADICVHDTGVGNPHAHIMLTMRPFETDGTWGAKSKKEYILDKNGEKIKLKSGEFKTRKIDATDWNDREKAELWRSEWANSVNGALEHIGAENRIDHRSFERQGIEEVPTVHLGVAVSQMERKGISTCRGERNREIEIKNKELRQIRARIRVLEKWAKEESLQENQIVDMAELEEKIRSMHGKQFDIRDKLKPVERRLKTLDEHIKQSDIYLQYRDIYKKYKEQPPKKQEAFAEAHRMEITLYEAANSYLTEHMNGKTKLPIKAWKAEYVKLTEEKEKLYHEYRSLKEEVREVEKIRRDSADVLRDAQTKKWSERRNKVYEL